MAKRRKKRTLRPRVPSRVKRRRRPAKERSHHHPELIGLGLVAAGLFLSTLVYLEWEGGTAGGIVDGLWALVGDAGYLVPAALVIVGSLMLGRSHLVKCTRSAGASPRRRSGSSSCSPIRAGTSGRCWTRWSGPSSAAPAP